MKVLDPWMYKRADLGGRQLAEVTLGEYTAGGARLIVLTEKRNEALPDGYWLLRGDKEGSRAGDLRVFDHFTGTETIGGQKQQDRVVAHSDRGTILAGMLEQGLHLFRSQGCR